MEQFRNEYRVLVGKSEGKRPSGRPRHRWDDNIKVDLKEVGCDPRDWIALAEDKDQLAGLRKGGNKSLDPLKVN